MSDVITLVNSGMGKQSMDEIRAQLREFFDSELALNETRAAVVHDAVVSSRTMSIGIAAASISVMMVFGYFISRSISIPISKLMRMAESISSGNLSVRSQSHQGKDEISRLSISFNDMADRVETSYARLEDKVEELQVA